MQLASHLFVTRRFVDDLNIVRGLEEELWYFMEGRLLRQCGPVWGECVSFCETLLTLASSMCDLLQSPSTPSSEKNGSDSEDVPEKSMPLEHKTPGLIHRDPKQDAILGEFAQRLANFRLLNNVSQACVGVYSMISRKSCSL